jgi:AhpD family alkylhydroperoxidase
MTESKVSASEGLAKPLSGVVEAAARRTKSVLRTAARKPAASAPGRASPRTKTTRAESTVRIGRSRKPTINTQEFASRLTSLLAEFPTLYAIWNTPEVDPAFREELMVAVARQNDAPYCGWAHRTWALSVGASKAELVKVEQLNPRGLDRRKAAAVAYVRALAATDFKRASRELRHEMEAHYTPREIRDIELVARVIDLTNRSANTYEAMLSRLQGQPNEGSHVVDEMVLSGLFLTVAPLIVLLLSRNSKRSYLDTTRSLIDHVRRFYAQEARG